MTEDLYTVWLRGDGYVGVTNGGLPRSWGDKPINQFTLLLQTPDWPAARMRIRAERTAAMMNQDLWPLVLTANGNQVGVVQSLWA